MKSFSDSMPALRSPHIIWSMIEVKSSRDAFFGADMTARAISAANGVEPPAWTMPCSREDPETTKVRGD
jgi:hypothetical protein